MLDGRPLVDVHMHAARPPTLKRAWKQRAHDFGRLEILGGVPGTAKNARAVAALCPDADTADLVQACKAARVYSLRLPA